ncbi:FGGY-family carbohydrate kinase [Pacificoceanicola onchidii]|uniref:FGGY-family carbohydrate kinase n=1 Tax=Pacificoceanicola onchidii TaxID=2562685 RepID=UPI0010A60D8F|nr:FGGY-family carbohydrate kinase [Pacificoceanicola onchidii]
MTLALGIDIGTSGVRTAVLDQDGALISEARAAHLPQDPDRIDAEKWWQAVRGCIEAQTANLRAAGHDPKDITDVAVDGTSGSMVLTDAELKPVSRALMYNSKGFEPEAQRIAQHAPEVHITRGSNSALGRAMRLLSEAGGTAAHLLHQADFITAKLTGRGGHSDHNNALKTGFDPEASDWPAWVAEVVEPDLLPQVHAVGAPMGALDAGVAKELGLSPETTVHAGTTDSIAAFLACAPLDAGVAVTSLGSTLAVKMLSAQRIDDPAIGLYSHRLGDVWLVGGASNTGGAVLAQHFDGEEIAQLSAMMNPDVPTGLDYYPLKEPGERFPVNDPTLAPRLSPRPESDVLFLQGMFEGIARIEAACYAHMQARGADAPKRIYSAGGGAQNPVFTDIRASHLGQRPLQAAHSEAAVGAARLAQSARAPA